MSNDGTGLREPTPMDGVVRVLKDGKWIPHKPEPLTIGDRWYFFAYRTRQRIAHLLRRKA